MVTSATRSVTIFVSILCYRLDRLMQAHPLTPLLPWLALLRAPATTEPSPRDADPEA